jgi:hypothetical protein
LVAFGWVLILILHSMQWRQTEESAYLGLTFFAGVNLFSRLRIVFESWKARSAEESLLVLTPRSPGQPRIKLLLIEIILQSQISTWLVWAALGLAAFWLRWIPEEYLTTAILALFAASVGACSSFLAVLSRRNIGDFSITTPLILLCCASGVTVFIWGAPMTNHFRSLGFYLVCAPLVASSIQFWTRPLQFPVQRLVKS